MCGITGIINLTKKAAPDPDLVGEMADLLAHRGPDDRGTWGDDRVAFGHRRLSILDLSPAGHQPMVDDQSRVVVTFNGEIYNFRVLREELSALGHRFRSQTDTEVLIRSYLQWGTGFLDHLNGMFAFGLYDRRSGQVFLVRDRMGIKPLYWGTCRGRIVFGSEPKAILRYPDFPRNPSPSAISSYLSFRYPLGKGSLFEDIHSVEPGSFLLVEPNGDVKERRYWTVPVGESDPDLTMAEALEGTRELLSSSVALRMIADVPVGAYLSGGLDSSIIAALMQDLAAQPVNTFTIGFEEEGFNEFPHARAVADQIGSAHHEIILTGGDYLEEMKRLIQYKDAPLGVPNEPALHVLSRELRRHITVVLSGEGADEVFGGYGRLFRSPDDFQRLRALSGSGWIGHDGDVLRSNLQAKYGGRIFRDHIDHFLFLYEYIGEEEKAQLLDPDFSSAAGGQEFIRNSLEGHFGEVVELPLHDQYMWIFQKLHIVGLLQRLDMTTMATSVEGRVPFLDHRLVEFARRIPFHLKVPWRSEDDQVAAASLNADQVSEVHDNPKALLRGAFGSLIPRSVVERRKVGFPVPVHSWLGGRFNELMREVLLDGPARERGVFNLDALGKIAEGSRLTTDHRLGIRMWMLLNLELWFQEYIDA